MLPRLARLARVLALSIMVIGQPVAAVKAQGGGGNAPPPPSPDAITGLDITPDGASLTVSGGVPVTEDFNAHNGLTTAGTYTFTCSGTKITCGSVVPSSVTLAAGASRLIQVTFTPQSLNTTGTVVLTANPSGETGSFNLTINVPSVVVTPDGGTAPSRLANSGPYTEQFTVRNPANSGSSTYTITCSGSGSVTCTGPTLSSVTLAGNTQTNIGANYTVGAAGTGALTLTATTGSVSDAGSYAVNVIAPVPPSAILLRSQNMDNIDRAQCLTTGAGEAAGVSCNDLFVVHSMPAYRSLGRDRAPSLMYNSGTARGLTLVAAEVTEASTTPAPSKLVAILTVEGMTETADFTPPAAGTSGQLVIGKGLPPLSTGVHDFQLTLRNYYSATSLKDTTVTGRLLVVNRAGSEYGQGWNLLGVDQILIPADATQRVLVGGDASIRLYHRGNAIASTNLSQSGLGAFSAAGAVDGQVGTTGWQTTSSPVNSYVQVDYGATPQAVTTARLYATGTSYSGRYNVTYSDDGLTWRVAYPGFKPQVGGWSGVTWQAVGAHRYWRLLLSTAGSGATFTELSFGDVNAFYGAPGDAPDSLERIATATSDPILQQGWYRHALKHGAQVSFDVTGRQRYVRNRAGAVTTFTWKTVGSSWVRLDSIVVPPNDAVRRAYTFTWDATTGKLKWIDDPGARRLTVTMSPDSLVLKLRSPGGLDTTRFAYVIGTSLMSKRTVTRKGLPGDSASTNFFYRTGSRLTSVTIPVDTTGSVRGVTDITPWDEKGLAISSGMNTLAPVTGTLGQSSRIDGPLSGTGDATDIWVDGFGGPTKLTQLGLNATTTVFRDSIGNLPALVTRVQYPNNRLASMAYNPRGNLLSRRDDGQDGTLPKATIYAYTDPNAPDSPTSVVDSVTATKARASNYTYYSNGLLKTATTPHPHTTTYTYGSNQNNLGLVTQIVENSVETWLDSTGTTDLSAPLQDQKQTFTFNANGNLASSTSPTGVVTAIVADPLGRISETTSPLGFRNHWAYDSLNRVVTEAKLTPGFLSGSLPPGCRQSQVLCSTGDALTQAFVPSLGDSAFTTYFYEPAGVDSVAGPQRSGRRYRYTGSGQFYSERQESGGWRKIFYNAAGQDSVRISRYNGPHNGVTFWDDTVRTFYDLAGRKVGVKYPTHLHTYITSPNDEFTPGDSVSFQYDIVGNLTLDSNRVGKIRRTYYGDGALESQKTMAAFIDSTHYQYSRTGQRTNLSRKALSGPSNGVTDNIVYNYATGSDELQNMVVTWGAPVNASRTIAFTWDALGRRFQVSLPNGTANGILAKYRYDAGGLLRRLVSTNSTALLNTSDRFDFTYKVDSVDADGRTLSSLVTCSGWTSQEIGYLSTGSACAPQAASLRRSSRYTRFNMLVWQKEKQSPFPDVFQYDTAGNMIMRKLATDIDAHYFRMGPGNRLLADSTAGYTAHQITSFYYDSVGNRRFNYIGSSFADLSVVTDVYYQDGLGRPVGIRDFQHNGGTPSDCMWYDADGNMAVPCDNGFSGVFYDGANIAAVGTPRWVMVSGPGLDDPLIALYRDPVHPSTSAEWFWVTDGNGRQFATAPGTGAINSASDQQYRLNGGAYAGGTTNSDTYSGSRFESPQAPGFSFFRNRVYDQATGRWTQEDPVGIAGGVNLYQYNGNNPVAYTDPFGLCPQGSSVCPLIEFTATVLGGIGGFIAGGGGGALVTAGTGGLGAPAIPALAVEGALGGAAGGLGLGKAITNVMFSESQGGGGSEGRSGQAARQWLGQTNRESPGLNRAISKWFKEGGDLPEGVTREYLENYRTAAQDAIDRGVDRLGVQANRVRMIDEALGGMR